MKFKLKIIFYWLKILLKRKLKSRKDIELWQANRMKIFAIKTLARSKFYSGFLEDKIYNWKAVPQISKTEFMNSFDEINTCGIELKHAMQVAIEAEKSRNFKSEINGITVGLSTGTSGKRGLFLVSENERAQWTALVMSRVIKPKVFKKQKVAFFLRANSNLYASVQSSLFDFKYFDIFKPFEELLLALDTYQPNILASQPSILMDIAIAQKNKKVHIKPSQIISFAEVLHESDKNFITNIFNTKITEVYQCTEGFLGASCKYGTIHLNEDFIHIDKEWIDENKFYPIVTDFTRHSQPVIKYKLNDVLQIKNDICPCGSPLLAIEKIIGRDDDILIINNIKVYPDLIARKIAIETDNFQKYAIEQINGTTLKIGIDCEKIDFEKNTIIFRNTLNQLFNSLSIESVEYLFENHTILVKGNKTRKIRRLKYEN